MVALLMFLLIAVLILVVFVKALWMLNAVFAIICALSSFWAGCSIRWILKRDVPNADKARLFLWLFIVGFLLMFAIMREIGTRN